jgi:hypothetical protein
MISVLGAVSMRPSTPTVLPSGAPTTAPSVVAYGCIAVGFNFEGATIPFGQSFDALLGATLAASFPAFATDYQEIFARPSTGVACPAVATYTGVTYNTSYLLFDIKIGNLLSLLSHPNYHNFSLHVVASPWTLRQRFLLLQDPHGLHQKINH